MKNSRHDDAGKAEKRGTGGTVNISRCLWDDEAFAKDPFSEREAWIWLIAEASWKPRKKRVGDYIVSLERGQLAHSTRFLASAWRWTHSKTRRFLDRIEKLDLIRRKTDTGVSVISICKYNDYQNGAQAADTGPTQDRHTSDTNPNKGEIREYTSPNGEDGDAVIDFTKAIFENGVAYLGRHGTPEARARSLIGKWRRDHADREIFDALAAANRQGCIDPVSYISGILSKRDEGERLKGIMADALREIREENARRNAK